MNLISDLTLLFLHLDFKLAQSKVFTNIYMLQLW